MIVRAASLKPSSKIELPNVPIENVEICIGRVLNPKNFMQMTRKGCLRSCSQLATSRKEPMGL